MILKDEVIILKEVDYKDYHKIIHGFSKNNGKISFIARNAKKSRNKSISPLKIFSHVDVVIYQGKGLPILNNSEIVNNFYKINNDYNKYVYACYIAELLNSIVVEEPNEKIFNMALKFFKLIEENKEISNLVTGFEFKLISMLGFRPQLKYCINCISEECNFFSIDQGGLICSQCKDNNSYLLKINTEELNILNKILVSKFESILDMNISNKVKNLIRNYLMYHIDKHDFKSLKLLEEL